MSFPFIFLDEFIGNDKVIEDIRFFYEDYGNGVHPLENISDDDIISWCEDDPVKRYPRIASSMHLFEKVNDKLVWKSILYRIFENASELELIFNIIAASMMPGSWSGSLADIMEERAELLKELFQHEKPEICSLAKSRYARLESEIVEQRKSEENKFRTQFESFE